MKCSRAFTSGNYTTPRGKRTNCSDDESLLGVVNPADCAHVGVGASGHKQLVVPPVVLCFGWFCGR